MGLSLIKAHPEGIPLTSGSSEKAQQAINGADILIDCTTSDSAFEWLNNYAVKNNKILISVFFDFYAKHLTLCISGKETPCGKIYQELFCLAKNNELPVSSEEYFYEPDKEEEIIEGAGCWHPTFPALYNHIQILAAAAVDLINEHLEQGGGRGLVAIVKRNRFEAGNTCPFPLVTIIWAKDYL
ncbi:MAG: hypothetical protein QHH75_14830 [Bacillota bacterium]|nr:hypothetical protein [Bacillota bacterium]